jgi:prephenate dehydrogenase
VNSVAIVGVGLIGGSFARALRQAGFPGEIAGVSSEATIAKAVAAGVVGRGVTLNEAASFDLLFLAQPIRGILDALPRLRGCPAMVTDAGSTKRAICRAAEGIARFTGGHPMAGKELRGVEHSDPDLFRARPWIFTSQPPAPLQEWVERIGARIIICTPEEHDRAVAWTSHLPQLLSTTLAACLNQRSALSFAAGPGLDSMTRLAASGWEIWRDIFATNGDNIAAAWRDFEQSVPSLAIEKRLADAFREGAEFRSARYPRD